LALKERDKIKIALKQPLAELKVEGAELEKEYLEIIAEELNVKKVSLKKGKELKIELDTEITPELEAEGYARELARKIQAERKNQGLVKEDLIELTIYCDKELKKMLEKNSKFIEERVNSSKTKFGEKLNGEKFKIKIKNLEWR
jgi:isoleucyl-tRNA synthetase